MDKLTNRQDPILIDRLFSPEDFDRLKNHLYNKEKNQNTYDIHFGRYSFYDNMIDEYANNLIGFARGLFDSKTLIPSYSLFAHYEGENAKLWKHIDDNACTYTIDMCVYQSEPWDLWVEGKPYLLKENQALAYYGNDQEHWREEFPNKESQHVAMIFFHFAEPDHWYFTNGPEYLDVIRKNITEEEWKKRNSLIS